MEDELSDDETSSGASRSTVGSGKQRRHMEGAGGRSFSRKNWRTPYGQPHRACHSARSVVFSSAAGLWSSLVRQFMTYCVDWSVGAMAFSAEIGAGMNSMAGSSAEKSTAGTPGATIRGGVADRRGCLGVPELSRRRSKDGVGLVAAGRQRLGRDARRDCQRRLLCIPFHGGAGPSATGTPRRAKKVAPATLAACPPKINLLRPAVSV